MIPPNYLSLIMFLYIFSYCIGSCVCMFLNLFLSFSSLSFYPRLQHIKHCVCKTEFHRRPGVMLEGLARPLLYYLTFLIFKRISKRVSDGLGGFCSISETLHLSARKNPMYRKFYHFILLLQLETIFNQYMLFISHLGVILALQHSNETYKYIKRPFRRLYPTHNGNSRFSWNLFRILLIGVMSLAYWSSHPKWRYTSKPWAGLCQFYC